MRIKWNLEPPPPHEDHYLITDQNGNLQIAYWTDADMIWGQHGGRWRWTGHSQFTKVKAWMPLPEPYRKEDAT